jgi:hypothetical protein
VEYIGSTNSRFGSRNGYLPIHILENLSGPSGGNWLRPLVQQMLGVTSYAEDCFRRIGLEYQRASPFSTTLTFTEPWPYIVEKYQLAVQRGQAHIIIMPHVTLKLIDDFCADLVRGAETPEVEHAV